MRTVLKGSKNCWPYWLENGTIGGVDQYVWLNLTGVECKNLSGKALTGATACKIKTKTKCGASQIARLAKTSTADSECIPKFTWESA